MSENICRILHLIYSLLPHGLILKLVTLLIRILIGIEDIIWRIALVLKGISLHLIWNHLIVIHLITKYLIPLHLISRHHIIILILEKRILHLVILEWILIIFHKHFVLHVTHLILIVRRKNVIISNYILPHALIWKANRLIVHWNLIIVIVHENIARIIIIIHE